MYPGIAIAREVLKESGNRVLFVGTEQGIEARCCRRKVFRSASSASANSKGMNSASVLRTLARCRQVSFRPAVCLREERPDVVIGIGGYSSGPVALAAWSSGIPLLIVEPNSYAGLANRVIGRIADKVILCFPGNGPAELFFEEENLPDRAAGPEGDRAGAPGECTQKFRTGPGQIHSFRHGRKRRRPRHQHGNEITRLPC